MPPLTDMGNLSGVTSMAKAPARKAPGLSARTGWTKARKPAESKAAKITLVFISALPFLPPRELLHHFRRRLRVEYVLRRQPTTPRHVNSIPIIGQVRGAMGIRVDDEP